VSSSHADKIAGRTFAGRTWTRRSPRRFNPARSPIPRPCGRACTDHWGTGDVDVAATVGDLRAHGYDGWYTLEQDTVSTGDPEGEGPVADVRTSIECLRKVLGSS